MTGECSLQQPHSEVPSDQEADFPELASDQEADFPELASDQEAEFPELASTKLDSERRAQLAHRARMLESMRSEAASWLIRIVDDRFTDAIQDDVGKLAMDMTMEWSGIHHSLEGSPADIAVACECGREKYMQMVMKFLDLKEVVKTMRVKRARTEQGAEEAEEGEEAEEAETQAD